MRQTSISAPESRISEAIIAETGADFYISFLPGAPAARVIREIGRLDVPVYCGEEKPLRLAYVDALDTHGADGLGESFLPPVNGDFIRAITKFYLDFHWEQEHLIGCVINNPLAVAYFADRTLCRGIEAYTQVETEGISIGQTVVDGMHFYRKPANAVVMTSVDEVRFFRMFLSAILKRDSGEEAMR